MPFGRILLRNITTACEILAMDTVEVVRRTRIMLQGRLKTQLHGVTMLTLVFQRTQTRSLRWSFWSGHYQRTTLQPCRHVQAFYSMRSILSQFSPERRFQLRSRQKSKWSLLGGELLHGCQLVHSTVGLTSLSKPTVACSVLNISLVQQTVGLCCSLFFGNTMIITFCTVSPYSHSVPVSSFASSSSVLVLHHLFQPWPFCTPPQAINHCQTLPSLRSFCRCGNVDLRFQKDI